MAIDELFRLTTGFIKGWKKGKLKEKLKETAELAIDQKIKIAELEEKARQQIDEIRRLKGEKAKPKIKPVTSKDLEPEQKLAEFNKAIVIFYLSRVFDSR